MIKISPYFFDSSSRGVCGFTQFSNVCSFNFLVALFTTVQMLVKKEWREIRWWESDGKNITISDTQTWVCDNGYREVNRYVCYNKRELLGSLQAHEWKTKQNEMVREQALTKYAACYRRQSRHKSSSLLEFKWKALFDWLGWINYCLWCCYCTQSPLFLMLEH